MNLNLSHNSVGFYQVRSFFISICIYICICISFYICKICITYNSLYICACRKTFLNNASFVYILQLSKLACIPCTLLLQQILPSIQSAIKSITTSTTTSSSSSTSNSIAPAVSRNVKLSLIPITVGVGIATVYDLELNATGSGKFISYVNTN